MARRWSSSGEDTVLVRAKRGRWTCREIADELLPWRTKWGVKSRAYRLRKKGKGVRKELFRLSPLGSSVKKELFRKLIAAIRENEKQEIRKVMKEFCLGEAGREKILEELEQVLI